MTEQSTGLDIEAMAREAGLIEEGWHSVPADKLPALAALIADRLASIPERMSADPERSAEARRALIEAGEAIRAEVG